MSLAARIAVACSLVALFAAVAASRPGAPLAVGSAIPLACGLVALFRITGSRHGLGASSGDDSSTIDGTGREAELTAPAPSPPEPVDERPAPDSATSRIETGVYPAAVAELFSSVVQYLNATSEPISEKLVSLRSAINSFLETVRKTSRSIDGIVSTDEVGRGIDALSARIMSLSGDAARAYGSVSSSLGRLGGQMSVIDDTLGNITRIAENVHVLSINASIESARAGANGRGFKVIANEIQKLAGETKDFVVAIDSAVRSARSSLGELDGLMRDLSERAARQEADDASKYAEIHQRLGAEIGELVAVYAGVAEFIERIDEDMTALSPIAMLHVIVTQEIENLGKVVDDLLETISGEWRSPEELSERLSHAAGIERIRARLTTGRELDALAKAAAGAGVGDLRRDDRDIEFF